MTTPRKIIINLCLFVSLLPSLAQAWWNEDWSYRKQIKIDTTPSGLALAEDLNNVPILIKLHTGNFSYFLDLMENGADLRFIANDDQTPLKFHIEKFDPINEMALIWVQLPKLTANANTESIWMYYGNLNAAKGVDKNGSYDVNQVLVYHFDSQTGTPQDKTAYGNNPSRFTAEFNSASLLGNGARFNGEQAIIVPAKPSLRIVPNAGWTFSTWLKINEPQNDSYVFHMGDGDNSFIIGLNAQGIYARLSGDSTTETPVSPITVGDWQHLAVTVGNGQIIVYLNGNMVDAVAANPPEITGDISVGMSLNATNGFIGELDEMQISNKARSVGWIQTAALSQGAESKLLLFGEDEQAQGSGSGSYFSVILQNVTIDGWVVIMILIIMALISWLVMLGKGYFIHQVRRDNAAFIADFKKLGTKAPGMLDQQDSSEDKELEDSPITQAIFGKHDHYQSSPIYRVYHVGVQDLHQRLGKVAGAQATGLSSQALNTIRAGLDAARVRETQRLNSQMVLLTIAISGGPFLGLLGTVVGVMITFAAIAATGDVNINAIAPGIAAALVATVAGLAVAIPALFGYNYLMSRIKEVVADMHVFVDEFVSRVAEQYAE
jgi:biopolymer transport protein ExbB